MERKGPPMEWLTRQKGIVSQIWRLEVRDQGSDRAGLLKGREGESVPDLSLASGRLLATWVSLVCGNITLMPAFICT